MIDTFADPVKGAKPMTAAAAIANNLRDIFMGLLFLYLKCKDSQKRQASGQCEKCFGNVKDFFL